MSAISLAKHAYSAFNKEKPHSSITEWVELLTAPNTVDEAYDGIPELVDSISIQNTGPTEASRALRKKLKHGDSHQQYRALVILSALVENGGHKFQTSFADNQLTDAIKMLASDSSTDPKVKKKLVSVLGAWHRQFKDDPSMSLVANLYNVVKPATAPRRPQPITRPDDDLYQIEAAGLGLGNTYEEQRRREEAERKEEKRKAKEAKRKAQEEEEERRRKEKEKEKEKVRTAQGKTKRKPFIYEQEKPLILTTVANASTASNNLVNAITLVNTEHDSLLTNERVQECLQKAKVSRKQIVRYIQLVENEEMIGTLIETNDRIIAALETYDTLSKPTVSEKDVEDVQTNLAAVKIQDSELGKLQEKQRAAVQRSLGRASGKDRAPPRDDDGENGGNTSPSGYVHPDLQDLNFGSLGADKRNLPPPIRPTSARTSDSDDDVGAYRRGSLSDYSDYASSDEEAHNRASGSGSGPHSYQHARGYVANGNDDDEVDARRDPKRSLLGDATEDPFADPFADQEQDDEDSVGTPGIRERKLHW